MNKQQMLTLLQSVKDSEISPSQALEKLKTAPFDDLGFAKIDNHRAIRQGVPEVIFGQGKTPEQIDKIVENMLSNGAEDILIT
ncbi:MAG: 1-(5-phosphoribosyl)-5-amino-4-imidazole-carboxylate carboxylase, partial [Oscillospiraceae bacterium]